MNQSRLLTIGLVMILDHLTKFFAKQYLRGQVVEGVGFPITVVIVGLLIFVYYFWQAGIGAALIFGGAVSNLIDRLADGTVTDFINIGIATMNGADFAIYAGIFLIAIRKYAAKDFFRSSYRS